MYQIENEKKKVKNLNFGKEKLFNLTDTTVESTFIPPKKLKSFLLKEEPFRRVLMTSPEILPYWNPTYYVIIENTSDILQVWKTCRAYSTKRRTGKSRTADKIRGNGPQLCENR
ncbi:hypothetical protein [Methanosarcina acetivorans]|uniref:Uncharacterized protein n=1 Tax=Methanosarcina acetivorans (strain ATCC 35395 / DSM 2834 / JCM 12185 / C2A) TaxID=188937 RepID=Q8TNM3_METAC|nr:hypothetical protein [Methanosarcina acetivorans]AAM05655.1 predicted protein [Methanosarcina acetivorans C2A]